MSKSRIINKLRQNDEYKAVKSYLDRIGFRFSTHEPTGHGHPYLMITLPDRRQVKHHVSCTPCGGGQPKLAISTLRRALKNHGYDLPPRQ